MQEKISYLGSTWCAKLSIYGHVLLECYDLIDVFFVPDTAGEDRGERVAT